MINLFGANRTYSLYRHIAPTCCLHITKFSISASLPIYTICRHNEQTTPTLHILWYECVLYIANSRRVDHTHRRCKYNANSTYSLPMNTYISPILRMNYTCTWHVLVEVEHKKKISNIWVCIFIHTYMHDNGNNCTCTVSSRGSITPHVTWLIHMCDTTHSQGRGEQTYSNTWMYKYMYTYIYIYIVYICVYIYTYICVTQMINARTLHHHVKTSRNMSRLSSTCDLIHSLQGGKDP